MEKQQQQQSSCSGRCVLCEPSPGAGRGGLAGGGAEERGEERNTSGLCIFRRPGKLVLTFYMEHSHWYREGLAGWLL